MTGICERATALAKAAREKAPDFPVSSNKKEFLSVEAETFAGTAFTKPQMINAAANYWKHRDEWNQSWAKYKAEGKQTGKTIEKIEAAGAEESRLHNLREIAKSLGMESDDDSWTFIVAPIQAWYSKLYALFNQELQRHSLL